MGLFVRARRLASGLALFVCLGLVATPAEAARIDVVVLFNGDRITGEVKGLQRGQLKVRTDNLGTIEIEWDKIVSLTAAGEFEVETGTGHRVVGRLSSVKPSELTITTADGSVAQLGLASIVWIVPIHHRFLYRIDGSLDVGFTYTDSSGVSQTTIDGEAVYRRVQYETFGKGSVSITTQRDADTTDRETFQAGVVTFLRDRWALLTFGLVERNQDLGLELRGSGAFAVGRALVQSNRAQVRLGGGLALGREHPTGEPWATDVDALGAFSASFYTYDFPHTNFDLDLLTFVGLKNLGRTRVDFNASVKRELIHDFYVSLSFYENFDSAPLSAAATKNDFGGTLSIGWSF